MCKRQTVRNQSRGLDIKRCLVDVTDVLRARQTKRGGTLCLSGLIKWPPPQREEWCVCLCMCVCVGGGGAGCTWTDWAQVPLQLSTYPSPALFHLPLFSPHPLRDPSCCTHQQLIQALTKQHHAYTPPPPKHTHMHLHTHKRVVRCLYNCVWFLLIVLVLRLLLT